MNQSPEHPSFVERTFTIHQVSTNPGIRYLRHPTGVLILTLSSEHELMQKKIAAVIWEVQNKKGHGIDRSKIEVSGKGKKGGLQLLPDTRICIVKDTTGSEFIIRSGIKATLLEVNDERLAEYPNLICQAANNHGFIAILIPPLNGRCASIPKEFNSEMSIVENRE